MMGRMSGLIRYSSMKVGGLGGSGLMDGDTNWDGLVIKSLGPTRIFVYCNGVYFFVEVAIDGVGVLTTLAKVILDEGVWGLNDIDDEALFFSERESCWVFILYVLSRGPYWSLDFGVPLILMPVRIL